jgi:hypothetical protein
MKWPEAFIIMVAMALLIGAWLYIGFFVEDGGGDRRKRDSVEVRRPKMKPREMKTGGTYYGGGSTVNGYERRKILEINNGIVVYEVTKTVPGNWYNKRTRQCSLKHFCYNWALGIVEEE